MDNDGSWHGKVLMVVTLYLPEEEAWVSMVFKGMLVNYEDEDSKQLIFEMDYGDPIKHVTASDKVNAMEGHVMLLRGLPRMADEMADNKKGSGAEHKFGMDYIW